MCPHWNLQHTSIVVATAYQNCESASILWKREEKFFKINGPSPPTTQSVSSHVAYANMTAEPPHHVQGLIIQTPIQAVIMETVERANPTTLIQQKRYTKELLSQHPY
ncbi:hypothetical protein CDAR_16821 [Caerostris darwini]|uniref:Uncharacterized protein n=1 Tax=Caerostris darwini TaxID=1538125 RepID=A0AAV4M6T3_9ARAC|nr:hypothetical protein CDAR_16821 [Caerostris darwini]